MNAREIAEKARHDLLGLSTRLGSRRAAVAHLDGCGLSSSWLLKFCNGEISNPTVDSVDRLRAALDDGVS
jgi:hypothetical protein